MNVRKTRAILVLIILTTLVVSGFWPAAAQGPERSRSAPASGPFPGAVLGPIRSEAFKAGEVLVKFKEDVSIRLADDALARYNATRIQVLYGSDVQLWQVPEGSELSVIAQLDSDPTVEYAEPNYLYHAFDTTPNDPYLNRQWSHTLMQSPAAWDITTGSSSITIAIIDSGIDMSHPDLAGKLVAGRDFVDGDTSPDDENGHGTHVAGIAAAMTNNGQGIAGVDWKARIMPVRVLDAQGSGYTSDIVNGITWAYQHGAKVLNLSLGGIYPSETMQDAVTAANSAGSLVVAAMGNCRTGCVIGGNYYVNPTQYPAAHDNVMAVAAIGPTDTYASYSQYGSHCDIAAPGGEMTAYYDPNGIYSTMPTYDVYYTTHYSYRKNYDFLNGTSQAVPHVSGLAGLVWALDPTATPDEVQTLIENTAADLGSSGWDPTYGHGRIDAWATLQAISAPLAPVLSPINNPGGDGDYLVDWDDVPNAANYTLQEDDDPAFATPTERYSGASSEFMITGQGSGAWYYRVRATNDAGDSPWSNIQAVTVRPEAPSLDPISNPGNEDEYVVSWSAAESATSYTLQEDDNVSFSSPRTRYMGAALQYHVTGQPGGTWYYRVLASNGGGDSLWSNIESTVVATPALEAPELYAIDNGDGDGDYLVAWSEVTGTSHYTLEESVDPYFSAPTVVYSGTVPEFSVVGQPSGHWYYRVRPVGSAGRGPWSNEESAIVLTRAYLPIALSGYEMGGSGSFGLPIEEGFEEGVMPPSGWTQIINSTSRPTTTWVINDIKPYSGVYQASVFYDPDLKPQNEVLLSPEFQASSAQLKFYSFGSLSWCRDVFDNCDLQVWLVVGSWGGGDDIYVYTADDDWAGSWIWSLSRVNLTPYLPSGTPVRVAFRYVGQDGAQIALDAVSITK